MKQDPNTLLFTTSRGDQVDDFTMYYYGYNEDLHFRRELFARTFTNKSNQLEARDGVKYLSAREIKDMAIINI
jgi:hypothetical protein